MLIIPRWISVTMLVAQHLQVHPSQADARSCTYSMLQNLAKCLSCWFRAYRAFQTTKIREFHKFPPTDSIQDSSSGAISMETCCPFKGPVFTICPFSTAKKAIPKALEQVFFSLPVSSHRWVESRDGKDQLRENMHIVTSKHKYKKNQEDTWIFQGVLNGW